MRTSIGEFLFILRKSKGMTQQEVADRLGVSNKTVSSWETGASCPDISLLPAIAELYGVTCDELLRGERAPSGQPDNPARREKALGRLLAQYKNSAFYMTLVGIALYAAYAAATGGFAEGADAAAVLTEGMTCGSVATVLRVLFEGRGDAKTECVKALLAGYEVSDEAAKNIAARVGKDEAGAKELLAEIAGGENAEALYPLLEKTLAAL